MSIERGDRELLSAGQFAAICGVNKQTLLYYEKLQLFLPYHKDANGRRSYTPEQIDTFHVILALREIMSLGELKNYIQKREKEFFLRLYRHSIQGLTAQITELEQRRAMMQKKIELVQEAKNVDTSIIYTQYCPREYLQLGPDTRTASGEGGVLASLSAIIRYRIRHNIHLGRAIGGILPTSWMESGRNMGYQHYYAEFSPDAPSQDCHTKAEGNYIICYHKGDYHTTYLSYPKILEYARRNSLQLGEYVYEESLIDEAVEQTPDSYITRISIPFTVAPPAD